MSDELDAPVRRHRGGMLLLAGIGVATFAWIGWRVWGVRAGDAAAADPAALRTAVREGRRALDGARARWRAGATPVELAAFRPGERPCAFPWVVPSLEATARYVRDGDLFGGPYGGMATTIVPPGGDIGEPLAFQDAAATLEQAEAVPERDPVDPHLLRRVRAVARGDAWSGVTIVLVLAEAYVAPAHRVDGWSPGLVRGRVYLLRPDASAMCVGDVAAESSADPDLSAAEVLADDDRVRAGEAVLQRDLEVQLRRSIVANLREPS